MTVNAELAHRIQQFVQREGLLLDERSWDAWLALYHQDCEYWVPMWDDDGEPTTDPDREMSLVYYSSRAGLEDRVLRIRDGRSAATSPRFRTAHVRSGAVCEREGDLLSAKFSWATYAYRVGTTITYFGQRTLWLREEGESFLIVRSNALVANDLIDQVLDVYHL
jgi:3-phenylpropionate/cinnamic acid dioxygenase small subunit